MGADSPSSSPWLSHFRLRMARTMVLVAAAVLIFIALRGVIVGGPFPWADLANALFFAVVFFLLEVRPAWLRALTWLGLVSLFVNVADGLLGHRGVLITPTHVLLPLLVLYGALLCDESISLFSMVGVLAIYACTAFMFWPLSSPEILLLTNLAMLAAVTGVAALVVCTWHRRLEERLDLQARDLKAELDALLGMHAMVFHDINNPLTALISVSALIKMKGRVEPSDLEIIETMSRRIEAIISSAHDVRAAQEIGVSNVSVEELWKQLRDIFAYRLQEKGQKLTLAEGADLRVVANCGILCNSVLGNILSNAIKFSPKDAEIEMAAGVESDCVRIEVRDQGRGFPEDVLARVAVGRDYGSRPGTDGERGTAYGLRIAALCAQRVHGWMKTRNSAEGGAVVAVVVPRANGTTAERGI